MNIHKTAKEKDYFLSVWKGQGFVLKCKIPVAQSKTDMNIIYIQNG